MPAPASPSTGAARLVIDLDAVARNYARLRTLAPGAETAAVVKADAYGLGAAEVGRRLARDGCRSFFVATLEEGERLRDALGAVPADIWVFDGFRAADRARFAARRLGSVLNSPEDLAAFAAAPTGPCALHLDTGMNRLGFSSSDAQALADTPERLQGLDLRLIMSHLACSEDPAHPMNARQRERFLALGARLPGARLSLANTGGVMLGEPYHFDLTRPGIGLYGAVAGADIQHPFEPVVRLEAPIVQMRQIAEGETVGYGAAYVAHAPRCTATVAAGYADGLPRALAGAGYARLAGRKAAILGRISMDLITLDVTDFDDAATVGARAVFLGEDLAACAHAARTLPYELLTGLSRRAHRVYEGRT